MDLLKIYWTFIYLSSLCFLFWCLIQGNCSCFGIFLLIGDPAKFGGWILALKHQEMNQNGSHKQVILIHLVTYLHPYPSAFDLWFFPNLVHHVALIRQEVINWSETTCWEPPSTRRGIVRSSNAWLALKACFLHFLNLCRAEIQYIVINFEHFDLMCRKSSPNKFAWKFYLITFVEPTADIKKIFLTPPIRWIINVIRIKFKTWIASSRVYQNHKKRNMYWANEFAPKMQ